MNFLFILPSSILRCEKIIRPISSAIHVNVWNQPWTCVHVMLHTLAPCIFSYNCEGSQVDSRVENEMGIMRLDFPIGESLFFFYPPSSKCFYKSLRDYVDQFLQLSSTMCNILEIWLMIVWTRQIGTETIWPILLQI